MPSKALFHITSCFSQRVSDLYGLLITTVLLFKVTVLLLLSGIQCSHASAQYYPCQIQSFFARMYGSGGGNLLRVHVNNRGVPTDVTFRGTCDSATLKFTRKF